MIQAQGQETSGTETAAQADPPPPTDTGVFLFADDAGGRWLARLLIPSEPNRRSMAEVSQPVKRRPIAAVERPEWPLVRVTPQIVGSKPVSKVRLRPKPVAESIPLEYYIADTNPPQAPAIPWAPVPRLPTRDVSEPTPLPVVARTVNDRASLEDPTADFSSAKVIQATVRNRTSPVPFQKINLPEPFEFKARVSPVTDEPSIVAPVPMPPK